MNKYRYHNTVLGKLLKTEYSIGQIDHIYKLLQDEGTFDFKAFENGLFPAATSVSEKKLTNYDKVWVRDNIYIANAFYENFNIRQSRQTLYSLGDFFFKYKEKFQKIIDGTLSPHNPMERPHIRFDGTHLAELNEKWPHAQNDALGYYLWLMFKMANNSDFKLRNKEIELVPLFISYFDKISYWEDEDSGHWEETKKIESSSIGAVLSALFEIRKYLNNKTLTEKTLVDLDHVFIEKLINKGMNSLTHILPFECIQQEKNKYREVDAAQLFLIYPLELFENVIKDEKLEDTILRNVLTRLKGEYGIKRYMGDSFWTADARKKQKQSEITADYSDKIEERNKKHRMGEEAQWCIFDSIVSIIYGKRFIKKGNKKDYNQQVHFFNRALAQITGDDCKYGAFKCPELYYLKDGEYTYNDIVPLFWAQANLWLAFKELKRSVESNVA